MINVFSYIKEKKKAHEQRKRANVQEKLKDLKQELKVINAENKIIHENKRLVNEYKSTKRAVFEAKHPLIASGIKHAQKKIKENKKAGKGIFAPSNNQNPFVQSSTKKKGKEKGPGEGIFY